MTGARFVFDRGYDFGRGLPLGKEVHGFVLDKPSRIAKYLVECGAVERSQFIVPQPVTDEDIAAVHTPEVIAGLRRSRAIAEATEFGPIGLLPAFMARRLIVTPQLLACGGTEIALREAAAGHWVFNTSGGFHHARPDKSHGFCLVNDVAWAVHRLPEPRPRILVLDLDLHQGDGNAAAFRDVDDVFTASVHQKDAFPDPKVAGDLDIGLHGGANDKVFLAAVDELLEAIERKFDPQVVVYIAGVDPHEHDSIGGFCVTTEGLLERDKRVAQFAKDRDAGLVALPAGGYSDASPELSGAGYAAMAELAPDA